ncbi:transcriptional regulator [Pilimelia anulata]|uniref:Transcriptional regulator n=1 Tax=Pilimelia anulata TaxID=53371 RepID=A0A8J3F9D7_9ACTN|nr:helix-turn-helix transcriptional regulator [Pilimelia anulata]GGJ92346.1 transcriptional regulator [Pilimelia anulata]
MSAASARAFGRRVAFHRERRGLSQRDLAAAVNRSENWLSQVERGVRRVDRLTVVRALAQALDVPLSELAADTAIGADATPRPAAAALLRLTLSSSLALTLAAHPAAADRDPRTLERAAEEAWRLVHAGRYGEAAPILDAAIRALEAASRVRRGAGRRRAHRGLARAYHAAAATLAKLNEPAAAWVAADRAIAAAERAGDVLLMAEGAFRLALVHQLGRRYDEVTRTARTAAAALAERAAAGEPAALSLAGALHLQLAVAAARRHDATAAYAELAAARDIAARLGGDRNDHHTEFGPTNVALHAVSVATDLGDGRTALRAAAGLDASGLSAERRARLLIDIARAQLLRHRPEAAVAALADAAAVAPDLVAAHWAARYLVHDLHRAGYRRDRRLRGIPGGP